MPTIADQLLSRPFDELVFLCGAGISLNAPTSLPTVYQFINGLIDECAETTHATYLKGKIWDSVWRSENPVRYRFELLIDFIRRNYDRDLAIGSIFSSDTYNDNHLFLANMMHRGASVVTTNFDCCIENAVENHLAVSKYIFTGQPDDLPAFPSLQNVLVKIHGSIEREKNSSLVITLTSLARTNNGFRQQPQWRNYLLNLLRNKTMVVLGYSGSDDFDITPVLLDADIKQCFWVQFKPGIGLPVAIPKDQLPQLNPAIKKIRNIHFHEGDPVALANAIFPARLPVGAPTGSTSKIKEYIANFFPTETRKRELLNTLLFHYDLHHEILNANTATPSDLIFFQAIQSLYRLGNYSAVVERVQRIEEWIGKKAESIKPYLALDLIFHYSAALYYAGQSKLAIAEAEKMLALAQKTKDRFAQMDSLTHLAAMSVGLWEFEKAQRYYQRVIRIEKTAPNLENKARANWGIADIFSFAGHHKQALRKYKKVYSIYTNIGSNFVMAQLEYNIGIVHLKMQAFKEAESYFLLSERRYRDILQENKQGEKNLMYTLYGLATAYMKTNNLNAGIEKSGEALLYAQDCPGHPLYYEIAAIHFYLLYQKGSFEVLRQALENTVVDMSVRPLNGFEKNCRGYLRSMLSNPSDANLQKLMKRIEKFYSIL